MRVLGMMSGTSVDGIDAALVDFEADDGVLRARLLGHVELPMPVALRTAILAILPPASSDVSSWCRLDAELGQAYARAATAAIAQLGSADLVSMHGQTLFHWVDDGQVRGTLQAGNPSWVAQATGVPVISDLRSSDVAAGGQGAPLASTLDALWLADEPTAALNLGGIANVTLVGPDRPVLCGDTGPANCLMDAVVQRATDERFDRDGLLARSGRVDETALAALLAELWLSTPLPRSTGRELFHLAWLDERLPHTIELPDLVATLAEFTARTVADVLNAQRHTGRLVVSGGGSRNRHLLERIEAHCGTRPTLSDELGIPSQAKESVLFALLGWLSAHGLPGVVENPDGPVTGASSARVLGSLTPPTPLPTVPTGPIARLALEAAPTGR